MRGLMAAIVSTHINEVVGAFTRHASQGSLQRYTQGCWTKQLPLHAQHCSGRLPGKWSAALCIGVAACSLQQVNDHHLACRRCPAVESSAGQMLGLSLKGPETKATLESAIIRWG